jgi:hypothetical protein
MLLHESLDEAVADVVADLPALADSSRRRGLSIRRRRRALATVGASALVSALAVGVWTVAPGADGPDGDGGTDVASHGRTPVDAGSLSGEVAPITGRGAVVALMSAVGDVADGTFTGLQGDVADQFHETLAAFQFLPASGSGPAGEVLINLQPLRMAGEAPYNCAELTFPATDCRAWELPTGDTVRTYRDDDTEMGEGAQRLTVEVVSPDRRLRLVLGARNTNAYADGEMRAAPVLTTDQLVAVATQPWWDRRELPDEFVAAGEQLEGFTSAGAAQN